MTRTHELQTTLVVARRIKGPFFIYFLPTIREGRFDGHSFQSFNLVTQHRTPETSPTWQHFLDVLSQYPIFPFQPAAAATAT